jgi:hypothetical protein
MSITPTPGQRSKILALLKEFESARDTLQTAQENFDAARVPLAEYLRELIQVWDAELESRADQWSDEQLKQWFEEHPGTEGWSGEELPGENWEDSEESKAADARIGPIEDFLTALEEVDRNAPFRIDYSRMHFPLGALKGDS